jgi:hypothetical protein
MRRHSGDPAAIEAEIAHLRSLAIDALRRHWRVIFGRRPPADLSKDLLGRMIACQLQQRAFGGLDRESLRFLDRLARHGGSRRRQLKPGTVLVRDYQGQPHRRDANTSETCTPFLEPVSVTFRTGLRPAETEIGKW